MAEGVRLAFLLALALLPCVVLLLWYLRRVRTAPEPWARVAAGCGVGMLAFLLIAGIDRVWSEAAVAGSPWLRAFGVIAPREELLKLFATLIVGGRPTRYERLSSGVIYAVAVAVGFAAVENINYVLQHGVGTAVMRAVTAVPAHILHAALFGLALSRVHRASSRSVALWTVAAGFLAAVLAHGAYDAALFVGGHGRVLVVPLLALEALAVGVLFRRALAQDLSRDVETLRAVPFLNSAPASVLRELARSSVRWTVPAGRRIVRRGSKGGSLFLVLGGLLEVRRREEDGRDHVLGTLEPGAVFGELAVLTGEPRTADVDTVEESRLLRIPAAALLGAVVRAPDLADAILAEAAPRVAAGRAREDGPARRTFSDLRLPSAETLRLRADEARDAAEPEEGLAAAYARIPVFAGLSPAARAELARATLEVDARAGAAVVRQGRFGPGLAVLLSGRAEVLVDGHLVATLDAGDFFGEVSLLTGLRTTATVRAVDPLRMGVLDWPRLAEAVGLDPGVGRALLEALVTRLGAAEGGRARASGALTVTTRLESLGRTLRLDRALPKDPAQAALVRRFPGLRGLPETVLGALSGALRRQGEGPGWCLDDLGLRRVERLEDEVADGGPGGPPLLLPDAALDEALGRSPDVLRVLCRFLVDAV